MNSCIDDINETTQHRAPRCAKLGKKYPAANKAAEAIVKYELHFP